ncbi:MAG: hypothetical protein HY928_13365 [Elusimicrobia bacterium]|nr:hypothetical protein [Elusimicrobiota bacterium]
MDSAEELAVLTAAEMLGVPCATVGNHILVMEAGQGLKDLVPAGMARAWQVLPLFLDGDMLAVAMADPSDAVLVADLARFTKHPVQPFVAGRSELAAAIEKAYR